VLSLQALSGCAAIKAVTGKISSAATGLFADKPQAPAWRNVVISASQDANQNSPVALDIVFIKDSAVSEALMSSPAAKWFNTRRDLRRTFPDALTTISLEVVPGQAIMLDGTHLQGHVGFTVLAFANYPGAGEHRERLSLSAAGYLIELGARGFRVAEVGKR
jgi:type VI secretion system protein